MPIRPAAMLFRINLALLVAALAGGAALAQNRVRTESIKPPTEGLPLTQQFTGGAKFKADGHLAGPRSPAVEIITDLGRLPPAVAQMRARIVAAARSGDLQKVVAVMEANEVAPVFSFARDRGPIPFWKSSYPDSEGIEALSILLTILDTGFVHVDQGTPQEVYLWPYFARLPLKALTAAQKVELFRIVTGGDYKEMVEAGAYSFYRVGIAPDGTWQFFVSGE
jgi:hypothetical protein